MNQKKLLLLFSIIVFCLFIFYSYLVAKERFTQLDFDLTVKFQDKIPRKLDYPFSVLSIIGSAEISGIFWLSLVISSLIKRYWLTAVTLFSLPVALFIEIFGKVFVLHPAPPHLFYRGVIDYPFPSSFVHTDYSYPSGHVLRTAFLVSFLVIAIFLKIPKRFQLPFQLGMLGFLAAMMVSRIYLGEHWTTDVIGGFLLGISLGVFTGITVPGKKKLYSKVI